MSHRLAETFGAATVAPAERRRRIRCVFRSVAPRYDLMNDLMSFGIHRLWKRALVAAAAPRAGQVVVDLAGGTGDVARLLAGPGHDVIVCDPSEAMMVVGRRRSGTPVGWLAGEGEAIPLSDASVDTLTIAFGMRNLTCVEGALSEMVRVLKPGGRLLCLEFSTPHALVRPFYELFSALVIPRLGSLVAGEPAAYSYLVESIRRFPDQRALAALFAAAGLVDVTYRNLTFGIACLHIGRKPPRPEA